MVNIDKLIYKNIAWQVTVINYMKGEIEDVMITIRTNPDIILPISIIPENELNNLHNHKIISDILLHDELEKRKFLKTFPTDEDKHSLIEQLTTSITSLKEELKTLLKEYHLYLMKIHMVKNKINQCDYYSKYYLIINQYNTSENNNTKSAVESDKSVSNVSAAPSASSVSAAPIASAASSASAALGAPSVSVSSVYTASSAPSASVSNASAAPSAPVSSVSVKSNSVTHDKHIIGDSGKRMISYHITSNMQEKKSKLSLSNDKRIAPINIKLENMCKYGYNCYNKYNPLRCGHNHHNIGNIDNIIEIGTQIPDRLCPKERPWENVRCCDTKCNLEHCLGRVPYILSTLALIRKRKSYDENTYSQDVFNKHPRTY
jgi:hypothetical protein